MKIKTLGIALVSMMLLMLNACKKDTMEAVDLLKTLPANADAVVVVNLEGVLNDLGCKIKEERIEAGPELMKLINKSSRDERQAILSIFDGDAGIDPKLAVVFYDKGSWYFTVALQDPEKFKDFTEKDFGSKFKDGGNGIETLDIVAMKGAQAWFLMAEDNEQISAKKIEPYTKIEVSASYLVTDMGQKLLVDESDLRGCGRIESLLRMALDPGERGMVTMVAQMVFDDADALYFTLNFKESLMEMNGTVLNEKGKPAEYNLNDDKLDIKALENIGGECDVLMALSVDEDLIEEFADLAETFGEPEIGLVLNAFSNLDGTVGIAVGDVYTASDAFAGVITAKGGLSFLAKGIIKEMANTVRESGENIYLYNGTVRGSLSVSEGARMLDGACMGIVADGSDIDTRGVPDMDKVMLKVCPDGEGVNIKLNIFFKDKENSLLTIIRNS